jgi:hypothetical protein
LTGTLLKAPLLGADRERVERLDTKQSGEPPGIRFGVANANDEAGDRPPLSTKSGTRLSAETAAPAEAPS